MNSQLCGCATRCGDDNDTDGPGTCKGLPLPPPTALLEVVLVPRTVRHDATLEKARERED